MQPNPKQLVDFFSRSLASFHASHDALRILCTLPHRSSDSSPAPRRPRKSARRLVVLDSSFNPPTRAHAQMARSAVRDAGSRAEDGEEAAARLMLLLAVNNADKAPRPASFALRLAMMEGFARQLGGGMEVDVAVTRMPFFHEKARAIAESGFYGEPEQVFLAGFDTLIRIFNPKYYDKATAPREEASSPWPEPQQTPMQAVLGPFFARARLRVTMRPQDAWGTQEEQRAYVRGLEDGVLEDVGGRREWAQRVEVVDGDGMGGVSSSRVREVVREGGVGEVDGMVDGEVMSWIEAEGLYRE
ncbi:Nucleotidylyl transferase [Tolypocladium capitatum]|uniref:Nucleotidylyl transferase n=1 Tax=Tolypocladium capitatum TaxID=45235 RepID=A0A2K3Q8N2_9HYPO|nr:Nucleotidylyl transferase [Tolypocladium capitatum]